MSGLGKHDWAAKGSQSVHSQRTRTIYKSASGDNRDLKQRSIGTNYTEFMKIWETSMSFKEVMERTKLTRFQASSIAVRMRANGVKLKKYAKGPKKENYAEIEKLRQSISDERTKS